MTVNLTTGSATGEGTDVLTLFEAVNGSPSADRLTGSSGVNTLQGAGETTPWSGKPATTTSTAPAETTHSPAAPGRTPATGVQAPTRPQPVRPECRSPDYTGLAERPSSLSSMSRSRTACGDGMTTA